MDFTHLLKPKNFDEVVGQKHLADKQAPFRRLCEQNALGHSLLYGPPGCGKTSLAYIVSKTMDCPFYQFNATSIKIEELRKVFKEYQNTLERPLIFIDEIHRLSKNQQEVLLPFMEKNSILLIGASTENPFFSLTSAMRSRSLLFELTKISTDSLKILLNKALSYGGITCKADALQYLTSSSNGDARAMLKLLEAASTLEDEITIELLKSIRPVAQNDGSSDATMHYDLISALIKSIRGSDCDAAIYYLARLIKAGESADFIARRLVILASEDISNANPQALTLATSAMTSISKIGYPEAKIILAQTVVYMCASPKSNSSYVAINKALQAVEEGVILDVPKHIKDKNENYLYPHDFGGYVKQQYLLEDLSFVTFKDIGYEKKMKEWMQVIKNI